MDETIPLWIDTMFSLSIPLLLGDSGWFHCFAIVNAPAVNIEKYGECLYDVLLNELSHCYDNVLSEKQIKG